MQEEKKKQAVNFKELYNKRYGDVVHISKNRLYTPEQIFELAKRYFEWAEENAIKASETASFQGRVSEWRVHKARVFTWTGLRLFCGFSETAIHNWRQQDGFCEVMAFIDSVINEQKYQLAVNGIINPGMVSKELGIDKPITINASAESSSVITDEAMKDAVESVLNRL